ncbi:MAG: MotB family protein [Alphaproteobacteria bacterium]|nr:MotB family protein [Alphaproteobacteria bacterium]
MSDDPTDGKAEIVIIRRRSGDDGAAVKGGAWKIAYADFVTAMMAFFLVMWLINASNEATRSQVASYFNPIKLTDSSTGEKGLTDPSDAVKKKLGDSVSNAQVTGAAPDEHEKDEERLLDDPKRTLDDIVARTTNDAPVPTSGGDGNPGRASQPEADALAPGIGDPFDPRSWEAIPEGATRPDAGNVLSSAREDVQTERAGLPVPQVKHRDLKESNDDRHQSVEGPADFVLEQATGREGHGQNGSGTARSEDTVDAEDIQREILQALGKSEEELVAGLEVRRTPEGVLISLTDSHVFGMFRVGSAEPEPQLVELMTAVAMVVERRGGDVVVRGHTDAKPYKNKRYDNWQLSTARAHMAQYMLIRGGLSEARIRRVEGLADREPRVPDDPNAAENRRIDVLIGGI